MQEEVSTYGFLGCTSWIPESLLTIISTRNVHRIWVKVKGFGWRASGLGGVRLEIGFKLTLSELSSFGSTILTVSLF